MPAFDQLTTSEGSATQPHAAAATPARVKVLNPVSSTGPSMHAQLLSLSEGGLRVRVPRCIVVGSTVQVRTREQVAFGEVRSSVASGAEFEIEVVVQRSS